MARVAGRPQRGLEAGAHQVVAEHALHQRFEHRHLDRLAFAAAQPVDQRPEHGVDQAQARVAVGHRHRDVARPLGAGALEQAGDARHALHQVVERGLGRIGAVLAETDPANVDDGRVGRGHGFVRQPQSRHRGRPHVVDEDVGVLGQPEHGIAPGGLLQVEHDAALVAVVLLEDAAHAGAARRADPAHDVAFGGFDLDHVGTHVAEDLGGEGAHQIAGQVEHPDAVQWCQVGLLSAAWGCIVIGWWRPRWPARRRSQRHRARPEPVRAPSRPRRRVRRARPACGACFDAGGVRR